VEVFDTPPPLHTGVPTTKGKVTLQLTVSQSVKSWCRAPSRAHDLIFINLLQLQSCFCGASSLTRGRVPITKLLVLFIYSRHGSHRKRVFYYCGSLVAGETCLQSCSIATAVILSLLTQLFFGNVSPCHNIKVLQINNHKVSYFIIFDPWNIVTWEEY
jgi:hypothetical protein